MFLLAICWRKGKQMASRVEQFIKNRVEELEFRPEDFEEEEKKVTVRLSVSMIDSLDTVAGKLHLTRTACAEQLLRVSIDEAYVRIMDDPYFKTGGIDPAMIARIEEDEELREAAGITGKVAA
jgi:hypothetical protein